MSYKSIKAPGIGSAAIANLLNKGVKFHSVKTKGQGLGLVVTKAAGKKYGYA